MVQTRKNPRIKIKENTQAMKQSRVTRFPRSYFYGGAIMAFALITVVAYGLMITTGSISSTSSATPQLVATEDIVDPDRDPVVGNPNASVTVVEFFDYQCPVCKRVASTVARLTREDDDVRVVFKEFPVFGEASVFAARASMAADKQGKYEDFHVELLKSRKRLS